MTGWKTWLAALPLVLFGLGEGVKAIADQTYDFSSAIMKISAGLAMIGIGHKIEKAGK